MAAGDARLFLFATRRADPPPVGRQIGLFENPPGIDHISFAVADVDGVYAKLSAAGVKFDGAPQDQSWGARMVGLKILTATTCTFSRSFSGRCSSAPTR